MHATMNARSDDLERRRTPTPASAVPRSLVLGVAGALIGSVPLPIVPHRVIRALRGALAHDVTLRFDLPLTPAARERLADPSSDGAQSGLLGEALSYVSRRIVRRWSPVGALLGPAREGFDTLALGRMLERYLSHHRERTIWQPVVRMEEAEAVVVRRCIDRATTAVWSPVMRGGSLFADEWTSESDLRDPLQKALDRAILSVSKLPEAFADRLDAAFDDAIAGELSAPIETKGDEA
jgi:hypothetical protein